MCWLNAYFYDHLFVSIQKVHFTRCNNRKFYIHCLVVYSNIFSRQFLIPMSSFIDSVYGLILGGSKSHVLFAYVRLIAYSIGLIPIVVIGLIWKWTLRNSALKKYSRFKTYIRNVISYTLWHISSKK